VSTRAWLAWLAGAQRDVVGQSPSDLAKHTAMGGVLLTTASVAGVSAAFALISALGLAITAAVVVGVLWAVVILNLDRMLVLSMGRSQGWWRSFWTAVPRLALAVVIGAVISTPLVLRIFQPEIVAEMQAIHSENVAENQRKLDEQYADIPKLQERVAALQATVSGRTTPSVGDDPDVKAARADLDDKQTRYQQAVDAAQCELDGTCGTGETGSGQAYRDAVARARAAERDRDAAQAKLTAAESTARARIDNSATNDTAAATAELVELQPRLAERLTARVEAQRRIDSAEEENTGLLIRLEALERLTDDRPTTELAHGALFLLFLFIELLPVLVKLMLLGAGPPTLYERLVARKEDTIDRADTARAGVHDAVEKIRGQMRLQLEQDRADQQLQAGQQANRLLVAEQTRLAHKAITVWAEVASARTDAELSAWYQQHRADLDQSTRPIPVARAVSPLEITMPITRLDTNNHQPVDHR
jgi:hypothetical protein